MKKKHSKRLERQRASTRELLGITAILDDGVRTAQGDLVFFLLRPTNIAVLSDASTMARVLALADVLKTFPELEMLCLNSREDFEGNKRYLSERLIAESVPEIRHLLEQDLYWLDTVQSQMATAREFALVLRLPQERADATVAPGVPPPDKAGDGGRTLEPGEQKTEKRSSKATLTLARLEKALKGRGFSVRLAEKQEIMRLLAVYFAQNVTTERFQDWDGQRFGLEATTRR